MFKEVVDVVEVRDGKVKVKFTKKEMCSCCKLSAVCGMTEEVLTLENKSLSLKTGDSIEVGIEEKKTLLAGAIIFLIPALLFVSTLVILEKYPAALSFPLAISVLCIYYIIVKLVLHKKAKNFNLRILRKLS